MLCPEDYRSAQSPYSAPNSATLMRLALVVCLALLQPPGLEAKSWKSCPADGSKDCTKAGCCETPGYKCYQKSKYWASCKASCTPGIDPNDPPKYQQPWTCKVLGTGPPAGDCPADGSENCLAAKCCATPGDKCYLKNNYWASCKPSCVEGIDPADPPKYQQPWSCKVLGTGPPAGDCPEDGSENCLAPKCCATPGDKCYMKNSY